MISTISSNSISNVQGHQSSAAPPAHPMCGIYDEFVSLGKKVVVTQVGNEQWQLEYIMKFREASDLFGYENYIIARTVLNDLLHRQYMAFIMRSNSVCWAVVKYLDTERSKRDSSFNNSEWGHEAAEAFCKDNQDFPIISESEKPLTLGNLIKWAKKDKISKIMLKEKVFET
ncbi:hypothetical protein BG015_002327 [Linnemannia schmuckeri]|uniref:Uncharacterized protein n=1 Tax=Linnemannia schmuckeri TaxID=64567 RepID=A0A9P5V690_9FUNG|nr:hypothetical protein BG015_002327 [Linnemannia schmuckeri]